NYNAMGIRAYRCPPPVFRADRGQRTGRAVERTGQRANADRGRVRCRPCRARPRPGIDTIICEHIAAPEEDAQVQALRAAGLTVEDHWQSTLFTLDELPMAVEELPDVFSSFRRLVEKAHASPRTVIPAPTTIPALPSGVSIASTTLQPPAPLDSRSAFPYQSQAFHGGEHEATEHLQQYFSRGLANSYKATRNTLSAVDDSTKFSPWLARGSLSAPQIDQALKAFEAEHGANDSTGNRLPVQPNAPDRRQLPDFRPEGRLARRGRVVRSTAGRLRRLQQSGQLAALFGLSLGVGFHHAVELGHVLVLAIDPQVNAALADVDTVKKHIAIAGRCIASHQNRFFPLIDIGENRGLLACHPGRRRPQVRRQLKPEVGFLIVFARSDLLACSGQLTRLTVLQQRGHTDDVLRLHVVAVLGIGGDHAHQLLRRRRHHIHLDAVFHQLVVQLGLAGEDLGRLHFDGLDHVAFVIRARHRFARCHQLVDITFELLEGKAGEHLRDPWVTDHVVDFAEPVVVAEQAFLMVSGVLERDELERGIERIAGDQPFVFHERQQRLFQVVAVAGVVHVENGEVTFVGIGRNHRVELLGRRGGPVGQLGGRHLSGTAQINRSGQQCWRKFHSRSAPRLLVRRRTVAKSRYKFDASATAADHLHIGRSRLAGEPAVSGNLMDVRYHAFAGKRAPTVDRIPL
nr:hypothetical protein [Tanacetum cinerariifolium]